MIVEYALTQYIRCFVLVAVQAEDVRFTFSQKLEIAYLLGFGANHPILLPTIERLNKVRNQVAHTFTLDRAALDEMLRIIDPAKVVLGSAGRRTTWLGWFMWTCASCRRQRKRNAGARWWGCAKAG